MDLGVKLVDDYLKWYKDNTIVKNIKESVQFTTPFVNHISDRIQLYITPVGENLEISDDGVTINELEMFGLDVSSGTRKKIVDSVLSFHGVELKGDELIIISDEADFPRKKHQLIQCILKIYDLLLTKRDNVVNLFVNLFNEEVQSFLYDHGFGGTPNIKVTGQSGIDYSIDYSMGSTKERPEILMQFTNNLNFNTITTFDFMFDDVRGMRGVKNNQSTFVVIANDSENAMGKKVEQVVKAHGILVFPWSQKNNILSIKDLKK